MNAASTAKKYACSLRHLLQGGIVPDDTGKKQVVKASRSTPAPADNTAEKQRGRPFQPGQSGNPAGRSKGSRNKLGQAFLDALVADFEQHGADVIVSVRETLPHVYLKVVAGIRRRACG